MFAASCEPLALNTHLKALLGRILTTHRLEAPELR